MKRVLVWDAPNMDMALGEILGRATSSKERPSLARLMNWLAKRAGDDSLDACVFVNIPTNPSPRFHGWLRHLSTQGYRIFAKPKNASRESDVDDDMVAFIQRHTGPDLREVLIASHDAKCFQPLIQELVSAQIQVSVIGYAELVNGYETTNLEFIDLESIEGVFVAPLPRHISIWRLPEVGMYFEPSGKPRETSRPNTRPRRVVPRTQPEAAPTLVAELSPGTKSGRLAQIRNLLIKAKIELVADLLQKPDDELLNILLSSDALLGSLDKMLKKYGLERKPH
jgi:putative heme uptake system protein